MSRTAFFRAFLFVVLALLYTACNYRNNPDEEVPATTDSSALTDDADGSVPDSDEAEDETSSEEPVTSKNITVDAPAPGARINGNRFTINGDARTFENALSYRLIDSNGHLLADGHTTAQGEMGHFNPYSTTVTVGNPYRGQATLEVFQYSAKDGTPIDIVHVPLMIVAAGDASQRNTLRVYFTNARMNSSRDCERVFAVSRTTSETVAVAEEVLKLLLRGPSEDERQQGYDSEIPKETRVRSIRIENGTAHIDFNDELNQGGGACHVGAIRAQIEATLKQFPTIKNVEILVAGNSAEALQP